MNGPEAILVEQRRRRRRRRILVASAMAIAAALLVLRATTGRPMRIKVINEMKVPMTDVRLSVGRGMRTLRVARLDPGESIVLPASYAEATDFGVTFRQPDGRLNDAFAHVGYSPGEAWTRADRVVIGISGFPPTGKSGLLNGYVLRRSRFDPAVYLGGDPR